jgi:hypothetical protein
MVVKFIAAGAMFLGLLIPIGVASAAGDDEPEPVQASELAQATVQQTEMQQAQVAGCNGTCAGDPAMHTQGNRGARRGLGLAATDTDPEQATAGPRGVGAGPRDGSGPLHAGPRDGTGNRFGAANAVATQAAGAVGAGAATAPGAGPRDGTGPLHEGPADGTGNRFGLATGKVVPEDGTVCDGTRRHAPTQPAASS